MSIDRKAALIQAAAGAIVLTLLMQPAFALGYESVVWLLFLPLPVFFAAGPRPQILPAMAVSFVCGQAWNWVHLTGMDLLGGLLPVAAAGAIVSIVVVFAILAVHQVALSGTVAGNVPALFVGFSLSFFVAEFAPAGTPGLGPLVLAAFWLYGLVMALALILAGGAACKLLLGDAWAPPGREAAAAPAPVPAPDADNAASSEVPGRLS